VGVEWELRFWERKEDSGGGLRESLFGGGGGYGEPGKREAEGQGNGRGAYRSTT